MSAKTPQEFWQDLIPFARGRYASDATQRIILNLANDHLSSYANWRWLTRSEPELELQNTQDLSWTPVSPVSRVLFLMGNLGPGPVSIIRPVSSAPESGVEGTYPALFSYNESGGNAHIRLWPKPPMGITNATVTPIVKLKHTRVTAGNFEDTDVLQHPDEYDHVFSYFLLDVIYLFAQVGALSQISLGAGAGPQVQGTLARAYSVADKLAKTEALFVDELGRIMNLAV